MKSHNDDEATARITPQDELVKANNNLSLSRRELLRGASAVGVLVAIPSGILNLGVAEVLAPAAPDRLESFTPAEAATVSAVVERLIPTDENGPGAIEAGVPRYIDRLLRSPHNIYRGPNNPESSLTDAYASGLMAIDSFSRTTYGVVFAALSPEQQDNVLTAMQANRATGFTPDSRTFFNLVRQHAVEGIFGDPYYGGNINFVGWDLIGYPGVKVAFSEEEQKLDVIVKSSRKGTTDYAFFGNNRRGM